MSGAHTPGRWEIRENGLYLRVVGGEHRTTVADSIVVESYARLIAAAPELLAALKTKLDYVADAASGSLTYEGSGDGFIEMAKEDLARINAAIAKATGEQA